MKYLNVAYREGRIVTGLAAIGAMTVGQQVSSDVHAQEIEIAVAQFRTKFSEAEVKRVLIEVVRHVTGDA